MPQNRSTTTLSGVADSGDSEDGSDSAFDLGAALRVQQARLQVRWRLAPDPDQPGGKSRKDSKLAAPRYREHWSARRQCDGCERWVYPWSLYRCRETYASIPSMLCERCHGQWLTLGAPDDLSGHDAVNEPGPPY